MNTYQISRGCPVKERFGRPGTRIRSTHQRYRIVATHGAGTIRNVPITNSSTRPNRPKVVKSAVTPVPADGLPAVPMGPLLTARGGGADPAGIKPGISAARCQP